MSVGDLSTSIPVLQFRSCGKECLWKVECARLCTNIRSLHLSRVRHNLNEHNRGVTFQTSVCSIRSKFVCYVITRLIRISGIFSRNTSLEHGSEKGVTREHADGFPGKTTTLRRRAIFCLVQAESELEKESSSVT